MVCGGIAYEVVSSDVTRGCRCPCRYPRLGICLPGHKMVVLHLPLLAREENTTAGETMRENPSPSRKRNNQIQFRRTRSAHLSVLLTPCMPALHAEGRTFIRLHLPSRWNLLFFYFAQLRTHQDADFVQEQANRCDVRVQRFPGTGNDTCGLHVQRTGVRAMIGCAKAEHYAVNYVCMQKFNKADRVSLM